MSQKYQRVSNNVLGVDICKRCGGKLIRNSTEVGTDDERSCLACGRVVYIKNAVGKIKLSKGSLIAVVKKGQKAQLQEKVRAMVMEHGISITADKMEIPRSTVGLWAKGLSNKPKWAFNRGKDSAKFKTEVAEYAIRNKNNYYTAKKFKIVRSNVQNWVKEYKAHGGEDWR